MIIKSGSIHERILRLLLEQYPITLSQIAARLGISRSMALNKLRELALLGVVQLEPLPDQIYVRLLRTDLELLGIKQHQRKPIKRTKLGAKLGSGEPPKEIYG